MSNSIDNVNFASLPAYTRAHISTMFGISVRTLERELSAGRFPRHTQKIGRRLLWDAGVVKAWIAGQSTHAASHSGSTSGPKRSKSAAIA